MEALSLFSQRMSFSIRANCDVWLDFAPVILQNIARKFTDESRIPSDDS